jgi:hypothetical protein
MVNQLKIIMDAANDGTILNTKSLVYVDDEVIGYIQDVKIHLNAKSTMPFIEITFPDFHSPDVDPLYLNDSLSKNVDKYILKLKQFPNVKIMLQNIFARYNDKEDVYELGTYGIIEKVTTDI